MSAAFNQPESEEVILDGGYRVGTGLQLPGEEGIKLMASWPTFPNGWLWDDDKIKNALVGTGGAQRYQLDRKKRARRVRNQAQLGKCNISSNASGQEQCRENQGMPDEPLNDTFTYIRLNGGKDEGTGLPQTFTDMQKTGVSPCRLQCGGMTKIFPLDAYLKKQVPADVWQAAVEAAGRFRSVKAMKLPLDDFETFCRAAATMIAARIPIVWAWHVGKLGSTLKNGFMQLGKGVGNHSNLIHSGKFVGGKTLLHPDNQNSWGPTKDLIYGPKGPSWGEGGFGLTTMEGLYECVKYHPPYGLISIGADENDPLLAELDAALAT
jgi:hypothetical protein